MIHDRSFGVIPLQKIGADWHVLLIKQRFGRHWSFPKGHPEGEETAEEAARREFFEETGLQVVRLLRETPFSESYQFRSRGHMISKTVYYFIAEVTSGPIHLQQKEVIACKWVSLSEAHHHVTFPQAKELCEKTFQHLGGGSISSSC